MSAQARVVSVVVIVLLAVLCALMGRLTTAVNHSTGSINKSRSVSCQNFRVSHPTDKTPTECEESTP